MKLENFEIIAETAKAWKLAKDGFQFWMPKSQIKKDGNFSKKGEDCYLDAKSYAEYKNGETDITDAIVGETEKALKLKIEAELVDVERDKTMFFFCPKSLAKDGKIPNWFFSKKIEEIADTLRSMNRGSFLLSFCGKTVF